MSWLPVGRTVLDRYVLVKPLARGGISLVYEAIDLTRMRPAAVKVLAPTFVQDLRACRAARQEPLVMQQLRHPSVPRIYAFGDVGAAGGGALPAVAMELLSGVPLGQTLNRGPLRWSVAVEIAASIAEMLAVAHRRGIVHRDLTPDNVMLTRQGVKVIDFGLAAMSTQRAAKPEQDVYALGVLLYQMLTGRSPYPVTAPDQDRWPTASRVARPAPTPVLAGFDVPRVVAELCRACMAKRSDDRPDSATMALELWSALIPEADLRWEPPRAATVACH